MILIIINEKGKKLYLIIWYIRPKMMINIRSMLMVVRLLILLPPYNTITYNIIFLSLCQVILLLKEKIWKEKK